MNVPVRRINQLDGLRGVLALWVVLYHMYGTLPPIKSFISENIPLLTQAWFTVDVFFVMSGFVMCYVYENMFSTGICLTNYLHFMKARFSRLYPVHLFTMLLFFVPMSFFLLKNPDFYSWTGRYSLGTFFGSLLFIQSPWFPVRSWNYPNWSISAEFHAYIIFPLLIPVLRRIKPVPSAVFLITCQFIVLYLYYENQAIVEQYPTNGLLVLCRVLPLFVSGVLLFRLWRNDILAHPIYWVFTLVILMFFLVNKSIAYVAVLIIPAFIITSLNCDLAAVILTSRPALFLGSISYSLYMVHAFVEGVVIGGFERILRKLLPISVSTFTMPIDIVLYLFGVIFSIFLAYITLKYIELPARSLINTKLTRHENK